jgi:ornithine carbamoyltransferase
MGEKHDSNGSPRAARTAGDARSWHRGDNPQVKLLHCPPAGHDPNATAGREMMERTSLTTGLTAIGEAAEPAASIVLGQAEPPRAIKAILLATLGR